MTAELDALKTRHRAVWALGDYPTVATELIAELGQTLVDACSIVPDERVLDVAAGAGNAAIPAALAGARVTALDLTPQLLAAGREAAAALGVDVRWAEGDAEALPYADGEFDVVLSCVGVMFAPHHQASADELLRVCRPGGRVGLLNWTPAGFIGQLFATMKPYAAPPPPGVQPPPLWGDPDHVGALLGDRVVAVHAERRTVRVDRFATPEQFRDYFKQNYGPVVAAYRNLGDDAARVADFDRDLVELARVNAVGPGRLTMDWEYLLLTARLVG
ncbi:SAM-dependent methyltransferase [Micromonospora craterilacus]|uniref:SAM-dependent methyltransferase n=1 Tax=Micromonospora craterilacus TaxID=1655439 RepID=A0A2W2EYG6_9ACTN|nr:class I SAM-dependent methyltransferase [Micromonospora craterilacus]PZG21919.1 SAM-dependent methyltransferase [Micromonospora craterilacus]